MAVVQIVHPDGIDRISKALLVSSQLSPTSMDRDRPRMDRSWMRDPGEFQSITTTDSTGTPDRWIVNSDGNHRSVSPLT